MEILEYISFVEISPSWIVKLMLGNRRIVTTPFVKTPPVVEALAMEDALLAANTAKQLNDCANALRFNKPALAAYYRCASADANQLKRVWLRVANVANGVGDEN